MASAVADGRFRWPPVEPVVFDKLAALLDG
jgi:hypothetical protein